MKTSIILSLLLAFNLVSFALGGCTGSPPTYNGLPCATTTRYWDSQMGACGCGTGSGAGVAYSWNGQQYTAAASQLLYDSSGSSWCGHGCGSCWQLTPTGDCPTGGPCATNTNPITIMITNLCPNAGNTEWCPNPGSLNQFGYGQHFDLNDPNMSGWVDSLGWNNPVVTYKQVPCGGGGSPSCSEYATCECASQTPSCTGTSSTSATSTSTSTHATTASTSTSTSTHATSTSTSTSTHATTASTSTSTHATTSTSTTGTSGCHATLSYTNAPYGGGGGGQVSISVTNSGTSPIKTLTLSISGSPSVYNLVLVSGTTYSLASYAFPLAVGSSFTGGGFNYNGAEPSVSLASTGC